MPSQEELGLLAGPGATGGSGDAGEDRLIAQRLHKIVDMPELQVMAFVKTRDRTQVHRLRHVLNDMPEARAVSRGGASAVGSRPGTGARAQTAAVASRSLRSSASCPSALSSTAPASWPPSREVAQQRMDEICSMRSSYGSTFSQPGGLGRTPQQAFNGIIRRGYTGEFDSWRKNQASDSDLKVLADACRAMRCIGATTKGSPTTYGNHFQKYEGFVPVKSTVDPLAAQVSNVPIGNLSAGPTSHQQKLLDDREKLHTAQISAAKRVQSSMSTGEALTLEARNKAKMSVNFSHLTLPPDATMKPGEDQGAPAGSNTWKSLNRASWVNDVHNKTNGAKTQNKALTRGEPFYKEQKLRNTLHDLSKASFQSGECMKTLVGSKSGVFCVSNPGDHTGEKINRFSFLKFA